MTQAKHHWPATYAQTLLNALEGFPERIALVDGDERITYRDLARRISQIAQALTSLGLSRGDGIAQLSSNCAAAAIVQLSAYAMGLRYTPLHPLGAVDDHAYILGDAGVKAFVFEPGQFHTHARQLVDARPQVPVVLAHGAADCAVDLCALGDAMSPARLTTDSVPSDIAAILYTGGTSGRPKGVALSSWALVMNTLLTLSGWEWPDEIRFLCSTPITHATGCMLVPILSRGGSIVLQRGFDANAFLDAVETHRITSTFLVPTMIYALTDAQKHRRADTGSLQTVIYGASPITTAGLAAALDMFGPVFMQVYSQSEAPCCATVLRRAEHDRLVDGRLATCGRAMAGIDIAILDERGRPVENGQIGEVALRGPSLMEGYWNKPAETAEALRDGWLWTGDLAYRDDGGFLHIVDRRKEMIVSGGFNVYPREVEDALSQHPGVQAVAVIGVPDGKWGEAVKAVVVARDGTAPSAAELIAFVKARKGSVAAPKSIDFIEQLPLTALGKPDKKVLRAQYWQKQERQVN